MEIIISKFLQNSITKKELLLLKEWLNDYNNHPILESYIRNHHNVNLALFRNDVDTAYDKVIEHIDKPVKRLFPNWLKYAAVLLLLLSITIGYQNGFFTPASQTSIVPKDDFITLETENGNFQSIDISQIKNVKDENGNVIGLQNNNQISYTSSNKNIEKEVFNTINIPNGKQFQLKLSDGTEVYLNSGSSLKYPIRFLSKGLRQVFLSGEAYFKVTENSSQPFVVNSANLDITVLGTEFNVSQYEEDSNIDVVLVKGSVALNLNAGLERNIDATQLIPGQKGSLKRASKNIEVSKVNTTLYTSWMQGHLIFRYVSFDNILKKLERNYNIEIINNNKELGKEIFNARFDKVKFEEVISFFSDTHKIDYTIENNQVIIK